MKPLNLMRQNLLLCFPLVLILILPSCSKKYSTSMETIIQGTARNGSVEEVKFFPRSRLGVPFSRNQIEPGSNNCLIVTSTCRGKTTDDPLAALLAYDQYLVYRIFLEVPDPVTVARHDLLDRSFVQLAGAFELPPEDKIYYPDSGYVGIESIDGDKLFGVLKGSFKNTKGEEVRFTGTFRARVRY